MADETALSVEIHQVHPIPLDVRFSCRAGDVLAIFGPSGSGKTTVLRSIAGLYRPERARIACGSETWLDRAAGVEVPVHRRAVGVVFQEYALFPHLTALGNVMAALGHRTRAERRAEAARLLDLVHLPDLHHRRPEALSGGERQRVALARALARGPRVLLLDEPFAAVDRAVRRRLQEELDELRGRVRLPIVLVTHDFDDVVRLATQLLLLEKGRALADGPLETLTSRPDLRWLRDAVGLGSVFDARVEAVDAARGLVRLAFEGGTLQAPHQALGVGVKVRVRVPAREVILATVRPVGMSVHNVLDARVSAIELPSDANQATVQLAVGSVRVLAEVTRDAVSTLALRVGSPVHALVKSVSLEIAPSPLGRVSAATAP